MWVYKTWGHTHSCWERKKIYIKNKRKLRHNCPTIISELLSMLHRSLNWRLLQKKLLLFTGFPLKWALKKKLPGDRYYIFHELGGQTRTKQVYIHLTNTMRKPRISIFLIKKGINSNMHALIDQLR